MKRITAVLVLLFGIFGLAGAAPSRANPSDWCNDGTPGETEKVLLTSPVFIGISVNPSSNFYELCYRTDPTSPGTSKGAVVVMGTPSPSPSGGGAWLYCASDPGVQEPIDCNEQATASATPSTSGTSVGAGGATIGVQIPFQVCLGPAGSPGCTGSSPNLAQTGVVIGALTPISGPTGSAGAAYQVSSVQVWLNGSLVFSRAGLPLGGGYVNYALPSLSTPSLGPSGTCVTGSICVGGMLGVTGATETVTLVLPTGTSSYPVTIPTRCLINFGGPC